MPRERSLGVGQSPPATLGLFEKRIEGDAALMELARLRFHQAEMGAEIHGGTIDQLEQLLHFWPSSEPAIVAHLPRDFGLLEEWCRKRILELAPHFAGRINGLVLHDRADLEVRTREYRDAAQELDSALRRVEGTPMIYVEYAAGLAPNVFANFFELIKELPLVSACVDVGHVGIRQARSAYAVVHPGEDICALKRQQSRMPKALPDIQSAVRSALPVALELIARLGTIGKPLHFHLHDGHLLSTSSPFGVSDHLSFFEEIALDFEYAGRPSVPLMFGPAGLQKIIQQSINSLGAERISFTLEIHPGNGRLALADAEGLFHHWRDKTNAERMNQWLAVLARNHELLREQIRQAMPRPQESAAKGNK